MRIKEKKKGNFPGSPIVKTLPSNAAGVGLIPGLGTGMPHAAGYDQKLKMNM